MKNRIVSALLIAMLLTTGIAQAQMSISGVVGVLNLLCSDKGLEALEKKIYEKKIELRKCEDFYGVYRAKNVPACMKIEKELDELESIVFYCEFTNKENKSPLSGENSRNPEQEAIDLARSAG